MDTASLTLCKELYKVSGWKHTDYFYQTVEYPDGSTGFSLVNPELQEPLHAEAYPAYDLGYLVRKFSTDGIEIQHGINGWIAGRWAHSAFWQACADTTEDAICQLALVLFGEGMFA